jgi:metallo-beta-lactamase family protein
MIAGAPTIKIHGQYIPVRARVEHLQMLSAHADADEILGWLRQFNTPPKMTFVTHGELSASDSLRHRIEEELNWPCMVAEYRQEFELT